MSTTATKLVSLLKPKRRWLQFSLKALMLLVVVIAVPCGLLKWKMVRKARERAAVAEIKRVGGRVLYDWKRDGKKKPYGAAWLRKLLGDEFFSKVVFVRLDSDEVTDNSLVNLEPLADLESLHLEGKQITDNGLVHLQGLTRLKLLHLHDTRATGTGLVYLKELTRLRILSLWGSVVSVDSLVQLNSLLVELNLNNTSVTDAGLVHLKTLTELQRLHLADTAVTVTGVAELRKTLPKCRIHR